MGTLIVFLILLIYVVLHIGYTELIETIKNKKEAQEFFGYTDKQMKMKTWYSMREFLIGSLIAACVFILALSFIYLVGSIVIAIFNLK